MTVIGNAAGRAVSMRACLSVGGRKAAFFMAGALLLAGMNRAPAAELGSIGQPAALIEEVSAAIDGLEEMDYVRPGRIITLGVQRRLVLDYLASCTRETIVGGTVTIGERGSDVAGGTVGRQQVPCAGESLKLAAYQADVGGVTTLRGMVTNRLVVGGTSPVLLVNRPGAVQIERLDVAAPPITLPIRPIHRVDVSVSQSTRRMFDLAAENIRLAPNGIYRATQGSRKVDFSIAADAVDGRAPLMARLLPL